MERKTKIEIINDLLKYNLGNRSVLTSSDGTRDTSCMYTDPQGHHCGVGQYLKPEYQTKDEIVYNEKIIDVAVCLDDLILATRNNLDLLLMEEVHGHSKLFWQTIQEFHDLRSNFTETGLSEIGQENHQKLLIQWELATFEDGKSD